MRIDTWRRCSAIAVVCTVSIFGQTKVDIRTQTKDIDFSNSGPTKPVRTGTALPSTCGVGEFFFLTTAPAGQNLYGCPITNSWSLEGGVVPQSNLIPSPTNKAGNLLSTDGTNPIWSSPAGDVTGSLSALKVGGLLGRGLSTVAPVNSQLLKFNGTTSLWEPVSLAGDVSGAPGSLTVGGLLGRPLSLTAPSNGSLLRYNTTTSLWEPVPVTSDLSLNAGALQVTGLLGRGLAITIPANGQILSFNSTSNQWISTSLGGDIGGPLSSVTVSGLQGRPVSALGPSDGQLLSFSGSGSIWQPVTLSGDVTGNPSSLSVSGLRGKPISTFAPSDGQMLRYNGSTAQWEPASLSGDVTGVSGLVKVNGLLGRTLSSVAPTNNQLLKWNNTTYVWESVSLAGDVSGAPASLTVSGLQGRSIANTTPTNSQVLSWNSSTNAWTPTTVQAPPNYNSTFTSATAVSIPGTQHNLNTASLIVSCYDNSMPSNIIEPSNITVDPNTYNVTVTFATPQSGRCVINGSGGLAQQLLAAQGGANSISQLTDLSVTASNTTTLSIGAGCSTAAPCNVRFGTTTRSITASATSTISAGTGTAYVYVTSDGTLNVASNGLTLACSAACQVQSSITQFPANSFPVATWSALNGVWSTNGGVDMRASYSSTPIAGGTGIIVTQNNVTSTVGVDSTVVPTYLTGTATLTFTSVANATCSAEQTISVPGSLPGDGIASGWPALSAGLIGMMRVSANDTVAVKVCNFSGSTATSTSLTYKATIVRGS